MIKISVRPPHPVKVGTDTAYLYDSSIIAKEVQQAKDWATKTDGMVEEEGVGVDYSSKAYAIGGSGTETNNSKYYAGQASSSATSAASSASSASASAISAGADAGIASTKAGEAAISATNAGNSATSASNSATIAGNAATTATTQAGIATTQAGIATNKATAASNSATAAHNSEVKSQTWAEGNDEDVEALGGTHSSLVSAGLAYAYANASEDVPVEEFAANHNVIVHGEKGDKGDKGDTGSQGPAGTVTVGTTTTGAAGTPASVTNSGTSTAAVLNFVIPKGDKGDSGDVSDVQIDGVSIVSDSVASIPRANGSTFGAVKINSPNGIAMSSNGQLYINKATDAEIEGKTNNYKPVVPSNLDKAASVVARSIYDKTVAITSGAITLDEGSVFYTDSPVASTTYTISTSATTQSGLTYRYFNVLINMPSTAVGIDFTTNNSVTWTEGTTPDMSTGGRTYLLAFQTFDGGTSWIGSLATWWTTPTP